MHVLVPLLAAVLGYLALVPVSGIDRAPPECYALGGYVVPCSSGFAVTGAVAAGLLVGLGILVGRRRAIRSAPR